MKAGSGAYVCQEDFEAYKAEMTETIEDMSKNNEVEFDDISEPSEVPDPAEAIEQIASGKSVPVLIGHIKTTLRGILALAQRAMNVALGRNQARVFATVEALDEWLSLSENTEQLNVGDNFYITATEVPDYWWDGTSKQPLETQKVDLTGYDQQISALQAADREINGNITALSQKITSFENTKSEIAASGLGAALGLAASNTWAQIVAKIKSIANRGVLNWSGSNTTFAVPAGYYPGGTLDSRPSYNSGYNAGVTAADNRANVNSANYKAGYNAGAAANALRSKKLYWELNAKSYETCGSFTAEKTGTHVFMFHTYTQDVPNRFQARALCNNTTISSIEGARNKTGWYFSVSLTVGNVVTFQMCNTYHPYNSALDGVVCY